MAKALKQFNWQSGNLSQSESSTPTEIDREIRELVRQCRMPSDFIDLDYQTEPSFFAALAPLGNDHELVLIQPSDFNKLAGLGIRSIRPVYLNGEISSIGYLHHLRFHPDIRNGSFLLRGYKEFRRIFKENPLRLTITSILEENHSARAILESNRQGMPVYQKISRYLTAMIPLLGPGGRWPLRYRDSVSSCFFSKRQLKKSDIPELIELFKASGQRVDGVPVFSEDDFSGRNSGLLADLPVGNFVGLFHKNRLVGAIGVWNQQNFRQIVLKNLHPALKVAKNFWQAFTGILGSCPLPAIGETVDFVLLDPWVVRPGYEKAVLPILIQAGTRDARKKGATFAAFGICESNPQLSAINSMYFLPYWSIIYQVYWPEGGSYNFDKRKFFANLGSL